MSQTKEECGGRFSHEHLGKVEKGVRLFNEQKYWECHEELEHWWLEDAGDPIRNVYWAIIQVAAAMVHYREGKLVGAQGLISRAKEKLQKCEELGVESPLLETELDWSHFKKIVKSIPARAELADFAPVYQFRFKKYL